MKLWFERGKSIQSCDVISMSNDDVVVEYEQAVYHVHPVLLGRLLFDTPYRKEFNSLNQPIDYDTLSYDEQKLFFPEMGDASRFKFESYHFD